MFPAYCFRQRTCVAEGPFNVVLNETWTHSCFLCKWPLVCQAGLYRGRCSSFLECVYIYIYFFFFSESFVPSILFSKSSRPLINPLVTVPKAPITIGNIVTFMFRSFFNSLARLRYLSLFSHSFSFILWSAGTAKSTILQISFFFFFFFFDYYKVWSSGRDYVIRLYSFYYCRYFSQTFICWPFRQIQKRHLPGVLNNGRHARNLWR